MKIRHAKDSDFEFIIEGLEKTRIIDKRAKKDIKANLSDKRFFRNAIKKKHIRVIENKEEPIGFLNFMTKQKLPYINDKFFWIDLIYIKENYRKKGLGKLLHKDVIKIAKKKGYKTIMLDIFDSNKNSQKSHKKLGFKPVYTTYKKKI